MKAKTVGLWKYVTATAISVVLLLAMAMMYSSTISNQAGRVSNSPIYYRAAMDCNG